MTDALKAKFCAILFIIYSNHNYVHHFCQKYLYILYLDVIFTISFPSFSMISSCLLMHSSSFLMVPFRFSIVFLLLRIFVFSFSLEISRLTKSATGIQYPALTFPTRQVYRSFHTRSTSLPKTDQLYCVSKARKNQ